MILNKTRSHRDRYRIVPGGMGCYGSPIEFPDHNYHIVSGVERNGYSDHMAVTYFLTDPHLNYVPQEAKDNCRKYLRDRGYELTADNTWIKHEPESPQATS